MKHEPRSSAPAAEVRKLRASSTTAGACGRSSAAWPALDKADPRERTDARRASTRSRAAAGAEPREPCALVSLVVHYYPPDRLAGLPRELLEDAVLANLDAAARRDGGRVAGGAAGRLGDAAWRPQYRGASAPRTTPRSTSTSARRSASRSASGSGPAPGIASRSRRALPPRGSRGLQGARVVGRRRSSKRDADAAASRPRPTIARRPARAQVQGALRPLGRALGRAGRARQLRWPVPEGRTGAVASGDDVGGLVPGSAVRARLLPVVAARLRDGAGAHGDSTQVAAGRRHGRRGRLYSWGASRRPGASGSAATACASSSASRDGRPAPVRLRPADVRARARDDGGGSRPPGVPPRGSGYTICVPGPASRAQAPARAAAARQPSQRPNQTRFVPRTDVEAVHGRVHLPDQKNKSSRRGGRWWPRCLAWGVMKPVGPGPGPTLVFWISGYARRGGSTARSTQKTISAPWRRACPTVAQQPAVQDHEDQDDDVQVRAAGQTASRPPSGIAWCH